MSIREQIIDFITSGSHEGFDQQAAALFEHQLGSNPVLNRFHGLLEGKISTDPFPFTFLPIGLFRSHKVLSDGIYPAGHFESSGTSGTLNSRHYYRDLEIYERSLTECFRSFYGDPQQYRFLALLPGYTNRSNASLVHMMNTLMDASEDSESRFVENGKFDLQEQIEKAEHSGKKIFLIGVTFALMDLAVEQATDMHGHVVMETGGMKGRRKEIIREEVHNLLSDAFSLEKIHSEYGMTELFSQAYSKGDGIFRTPHWMKVIITETHDPFCILPAGRTGRINVIDLANTDSCAFIATDDLGRLYTDGSFEVLGRMDQSALRGCNLMAI